MTADTIRPAALPQQPSMRRLIVAATIGNVFAWFDFVVYGFFAVTLAEVFFPTGNATASLLVTFGAFGLAYLVRPLGAIVVGGYTDRGRRMFCLLLSMAPLVQRQLAICDRRHHHGYRLRVRRRSDVVVDP